MNRKDKPDPKHVDVPRLMEVICELKSEKYLFEKIVSLLTFSTWLMIPKESEYVRRAELVSAASVILAVRNGQLSVPSSKRTPVVERIAKSHFSTSRVAEALVDRFEISDISFADAGFIAAFIARCPKEYKPSANRALAFVQKGGFADDLEMLADEATLSHQTLKNGWKDCAASSPFSVVAPRLKMTAIEELEVDDKDSVAKAREILQDTTALRQFFGAERYVQDVLIERLHESSLQKIPFVKFPDSIPAHVIEPRPFSPAQLQIIKSYAVPGISKFGPPIE